MLSPSSLALGVYYALATSYSYLITCHMHVHYIYTEMEVNLDNVLIQLRPQVSTKWYEFGKAAGVDKTVLDNFAKECAPEDCIVETLDHWLRRCEDKPTWSDIAKILKMINLPVLASDIENVYTTGKN